MLGTRVQRPRSGLPGSCMSCPLTGIGWGRRSDSCLAVGLNKSHRSGRIYRIQPSSCQRCHRGTDRHCPFERDRSDTKCSSRRKLSSCCTNKRKLSKLPCCFQRIQRYTHKLRLIATECFHRRTKYTHLQFRHCKLHM